MGAGEKQMRAAEGTCGAGAGMSRAAGPGGRPLAMPGAAVARPTATGAPSWVNLLVLGVGIGCMWLPIHYSFYRYSIVGEGPIYALALAVMALACVLAIAFRGPLSRWLARRPVLVVASSFLTLAGNGLMLGLPYLPLPPGLAAAIRVAAVALYSAVFVLLFFAWAERMADLMFQVPIVTSVGVVGLSITAVFLLVNLCYGTFAYQAAALVCLAVSGACWQGCALESVEVSGELRLLPSGRTMREWSLLFVAFLLVTLLHAVTFSAGGQSSEQSDFPTLMLHLVLVLFAVPFAALLYAGRMRGISSQRSLSLIISLIVASYLGLLCAMAIPGVVTDDGHLAALTVILRTLRIFIFVVLMTMCYRDAVAPASTFGLLFLLVEIVANVLCYLVVPAVFAATPAEPHTLFVPTSSAVALVLIVVLGGFLAMHFTGTGRVAAESDARLRDAEASGPTESQEASDARPDAPEDVAGRSDQTGQAGRVEADPAGFAVAPDGGPASDPVACAERPAAAADREPGRRERCRSLAAARGLTEREADIMYYLSLGFSVKKIADMLVISANTVATHSARLYRKLGVHARQELIDLVDEAAA